MTANSEVTDRYSGYAIGLHWATTALIVALFFVGWRMVALPISPAKFELYALHKSLGVVVLAVTVWRLAVRLLRPAPDAIDAQPGKCVLPQRHMPFVCTASCIADQWLALQLGRRLSSQSVRDG